MINNTVQGVNPSIGSGIAINPQTGNVTTPTAFSAGNQPPLSASYDQNKGLATSLMGPLANSNPITGLVSPTIAPLGSLGSSPVTTHTITSAPDGTVTQKVAHADTTSTDTSGGGSTTPPATTPPAPATPPPEPPTPPIQANPYIGQTAASAQGNTALSQDAENIRNQYQGLIAQTGILGAGLAENDQSGGTSTSIGQGLANLAYQSTSARANALANDEQQQLASLTPQLQAQQQTTQGLASAGQLASPSNTLTSIAPGSTPYNAQGQPVANGLGNLSAYQTELINNAQRGTYGAQAQSISTGLTALDNTYQNVQAIGAKYGINPTSFPTANSYFQALQAQATDPGGQQAFNEAMSQFKAQLASQIQNFTSSGALTPTASSAYMSQLDAATLNPAQLGTLYDAVKAGAQANLNAASQAFNQSNAATQNGGFPSTFSGSTNPSTYSPPANIGGANYYDPANYNIQ